MVAKFDIGDVVVIGERPTDITSAYFDDAMEQYAGEVGKITWVGYHPHYNQHEYHVDCGGGWYWLESWLYAKDEFESLDNLADEVMDIIGVSV